MTILKENQLFSYSIDQNGRPVNTQVIREVAYHYEIAYVLDLPSSEKLPELIQEINSAGNCTVQSVTDGLHTQITVRVVHVGNYLSPLDVAQHHAASLLQGEIPLAVSAQTWYPGPGGELQPVVSLDNHSA